MSVVKLTVPYSQKDLVKALGAKWNPDMRSWTIAESMDREPFKAWLPSHLMTDKKQNEDFKKEKTVSSIFPSDDEIDERESIVEAKHQKLSEFLFKIAGVINQNFSEPQWVQVELSKVSGNHHLYFDFVEYDASGNESAKARGALWAANKNKLLSKFSNATGGPISDGMKLLIKLKANFSAQFGFSFTVEDIDPSFTLGDMQAKLKAIRDRLLKEGLYEKNKQLIGPREFTRVAVISPDGAAGLADFMREADVLKEFSLCEFIYYTATFQGVNAQTTIVSALHDASRDNEENPFDALVVIRGGGAAADLAWLNNYEIAKEVCLSNCPVFTGIGHQIDNTILDEVSYRRFDTPSKVSAYITGVIVDNANDAINNMLSIMGDSKKMIILTETKLDNMMSSIKTDGINFVNKIEAELPVYIDKIRMSTTMTLELLAEKMQSMMNDVLGLSPKNTLARGYAILRDMKGKPITSVSLVTQDDEVSLELKDGTVRTKVINMESSYE